jgi:hypothetical protein
MTAVKTTASADVDTRKIADWIAAIFASFTAPATIGRSFGDSMIAGAS